jgi:hypothetical protein
VPVTGSRREGGETHGHFKPVGGFEVSIRFFEATEQGIELTEAAVRRSFDGRPSYDDQQLAAVGCDLA